MDRRTLTRDEALDTVRRYKQVIRPRYKTEPKVYMYGSYAKGHATPDSDIDVAVIVPTYGDRKHEISMGLWRERSPRPLPTGSAKISTCCPCSRRC